MNLISIYGFVTLLNIVLWVLLIFLNELDDDYESKVYIDAEELLFIFVYWILMWPLSYSLWVIKQLRNNPVKPR
jgi:hypothetical protein